MEINVSYLHDILAYMIEAQYWDHASVEDYLGFVEEYREHAKDTRDDEHHEAFKNGLRHTLKGILNNPHLDYDAIILDGAMHGLGSQENAKKLLELIWRAFFAEADWRDDSFTADNVILTDQGFTG